MIGEGARLIGRGQHHRRRPVADRGAVVQAQRRVDDARGGRLAHADAQLGGVEVDEVVKLPFLGGLVQEEELRHALP